MPKYRVLRDFPGHNKGEIISLNPLVYEFNGVLLNEQGLMDDGWIEEVKEKTYKEKAFEHGWGKCKSHYKEKVLREFDQYAEYCFRERETKGEIRKSIEQAFEE